MKNFSSTKLFKVLVTIVIFGFLIFLNPYNVFRPIRNAFIVLASPFQKVGYILSFKTAAAKEFIFSIGELKKENERLTKDNLGYISENSRLHDVEKENDLLREQLNLLPREKFNLTASYVISQDTQGLGNWLEIDKGSNDGLKPEMPVIVSKGILIGKIQEVTSTTSKVLLLTNPKSSLNVMTAKSASKGILKGEYGLGVQMDMILQTDSVQPGDEVVTSGIGGNMPRGLFIGTIQDVHPSDDHLFQQANVSNPIQVAKLQTVFVVTEIKKNE